MKLDPETVIRRDERKKVLDELSRKFVGKNADEIKDIMFFEKRLRK